MHLVDTTNEAMLGLPAVAVLIITTYLLAKTKLPLLTTLTSSLSAWLITAITLLFISSKLQH